MKEFIEAERRRFEGLLRLFNERGSRMEVFGEDGKRILGDLVDSFMVMRIAPHFDAQGHHIRSDFWLLWKSVGYDNGWQYAHTVKIVKVRVRDTLQSCWLIVDLTDDRGRRFHVELIEPANHEAHLRQRLGTADFLAPDLAHFLHAHMPKTALLVIRCPKGNAGSRSLLKGALYQFRCLIKFGSACDA